MAETTGIAWTQSTFNPWIGCTKVGPGCDHCYAEATDARFYNAEHWGAGAPRLLTSDKNWRQPLNWNARALAEGRRHKVFCASQADVFDNEVPDAWRERLWALIRATPMLDWQLVTKRVGNVAKMLPADWGVHGYPNVWLIITVVTQKEAERDIPKLLNVPAVVRGLSMEPQIEPVTIHPAWVDASWAGGATIDWLITGGESRPDAPMLARAYHLEWAEEAIATARRFGRAAFFKQTGHNPRYRGVRYPIAHNKGEIPEEWPVALRVRDFPVPRPVPYALDRLSA